MPFIKGIKADIQGIDTTREFILVDAQGDGWAKKGDILILIQDSNSLTPIFQSRISGEKYRLNWGMLEYYDNKEPVNILNKIISSKRMYNR